MSQYFDSSVLVSLFLDNPGFSERSNAFIEKINYAVPINRFQLLELNNAFSLAIFRKKVDAEHRQFLLSKVESYFNKGDFKECPVNYETAISHANILANFHSPNIGSRSLDIIHVALAISSNIRDFITFDKRQAELAKAAGLNAIDL